MAKSSCAEIRSHLYVALDIDYLPKSTFHQVSSQTEEVAKILAGLRSSVRKKMQMEKQAQS